jgi:hypothetical protein
VKLRWWYGIILNLILAALAISGAAFYVTRIKGAPETGTLEIRDAVTGKVYGKWPLQEGEEFAVEFVHSVHQSPVREIFTAEGKMIRPVRVRFSSFGAGMQSDLEEGQVMSRDGDAMLISGFNTSFKELNYIVGTVSDHVLITRDESVRLRELCGRNAHITILYGGEKR